MLAAVAGWALALAAIAAGVGWLYQLDKLGIWDLGPRVAGSLPLEDLASRSAQPLARMALAWIPAGVAATLALAWVARVSRAWLAPAVVLLAAALLFPTTAAFDALTHNELVTAHIGQALTGPGVWVALALILIGSIPTAALARRGRRGRGTAASGTGANGPVAA